LEKLSGPLLEKLSGPPGSAAHMSGTTDLTLRLLMSYIYMELLVKPEMLTSYIYGPTFGNA